MPEAFHTRFPVSVSVQSFRKRKRKFCVVVTYSTNGAGEIRKFHVAVVQQLLRNGQKKA